MRRTILGAATQEFLAKGYQRTRIRTTIEKGRCLTPGLLRALPQQESPAGGELRRHGGVVTSTDRAEGDGDRGPWRAAAAAYLGQPARAGVPEGRTGTRSLHARGGGRGPEVGPAGVGRGGQEHRRRSFQCSCTGGAGTPPVSLELLAYSLIGALHEATFRADWGDDFDYADVMRVHLWLWLAALAALDGETDVEARLARYETLIQRLAAAAPQVPPPIDDSAGAGTTSSEAPGQSLRGAGRRGAAAPQRRRPSAVSLLERS